MADIGVVVVDDPADAHGQRVIDALSAHGVRATRYDLGDVRTRLLRVEPSILDIRDVEWDRIGHQTTVWWRRAGSVAVEDLDEEEALLARDEIIHLFHGALTAAGVRWVDDPFDVRRAELKLHQLGLARSLGIAIPQTCVTNDPIVGRAFLQGRRVVAKPLSPGQGIGPFVAEVSADDLDRVATLPTLLQERVTADADLRVTVVGADVEVWRRARSTDTIDWRAEDPGGSEFVRSDLTSVSKAALAMTSGLQLSMSVQDWLETPAGPVFLEANPQGAWLFLHGAESVTAQVARHLATPSMERPGVWPRAIKRVLWDFAPAGKAPENDGVVAPRFARPGWIDEVAARNGALNVAIRAHEQAKAAAQGAEDKAGRLVQVALALLTIALALGAFQATLALERSWPWLLSLGPASAALISLALAAFEGTEIDRVGIYQHPSGEDLAGVTARDPVAILIEKEEAGRRLARWTSTHKHSDLMQARAWFTRGLAALIAAALIAGFSRAAAPHDSAGSTSPTTLPPHRARPIRPPPPSVVPQRPSTSGLP